MTPMTEQHSKLRLRTGYIVFGLLAGLKIADYLVSKAVPAGAWTYLGLLAIASAGLIIYFYMHSNELFSSEKKENR
jgi:hypothetical protein